MQLTAYHAKYFAYDLTRRCASDSVEKLAAVLANAQVDLNPHQIEAALFVFPLCGGGWYNNGGFIVNMGSQRWTLSSQKA